jgi:hypothetical protein
MKQDEIIELARQAEIIHPEMVAKHLEAFAKLVAEKEREMCAKICEDLDLPFVADAIHARKNK